MGTATFSPKILFQKLAHIFPLILLLANAAFVAEREKSAVTCPEDEKNVMPCFCRPNLVTGFSSGAEVICETGDQNRHVKEDSLTNFIQQIRKMNNYTAEQWLHLARVRIAYTELTSLDLSSLLYTKVDKLEISNNAHLKMIALGQTVPSPGEIIKVSSLLIEENESLDDEGVGHLFRYFDPLLVADVEFFHNRLRGLDSSGKRLPEFLPGLSGFTNLKIASFFANGIKSIGQRTFKKMTKLEKLDLSGNEIEMLDEDSLLIDSDSHSDAHKDLHVRSGSGSSTNYEFGSDLDLYYNLALEIDLSANRLSEHSIPANSGLERIKRRIKVDLSVNSFKTIPRIPFEAIFDADPDNRILFYGNDLICDSPPFVLQSAASAIRYRNLLSRNRQMQNALTHISRQIDGFKLMTEGLQDDDPGTTFLIENIRDILRETQVLTSTPYSAQQQQQRLVTNKSGSKRAPVSVSGSRNCKQSAARNAEKLCFGAKLCAELLITTVILLLFYLIFLE